MPSYIAIICSLRIMILLLHIYELCLTYKFSHFPYFVYFRDFVEDAKSYEQNGWKVCSMQQFFHFFMRLLCKLADDEKSKSLSVFL